MLIFIETTYKFNDIGLIATYRTTTIRNGTNRIIIKLTMLYLSNFNALQAIQSPFYNSLPQYPISNLYA